MKKLNKKLYLKEKKAMKKIIEMIKGFIVKEREFVKSLKNYSKAVKKWMRTYNLHAWDMYGTKLINELKTNDVLWIICHNKEHTKIYYLKYMISDECDEYGYPKDIYVYGCTDCLES